MKSLKIPENNIYNAYLIEGEDMEFIKAAAVGFAEKLLMKDIDKNNSETKNLSIYEERGYASLEEWQDSVKKRVSNNEHPDLFVISPDKPEDNPTTISVGNIRENIANAVEIRPYEAIYKVYLIEHAECMNQQAQNALLKTLEEPPEYVVIMLLATNSDAFLPTILSRVIEIKAGERDVKEIMNDMISEDWSRETVHFLAEITFKNSREIIDFTDKITKEWKVPIRTFLCFIEIVLRDVLCYKSTSKIQLIYGQEISEDIIKMANVMSYERIGRATDNIERAFRDLTLNVNKEIMIEDFLLKLRQNHH
ncbi:DNA polymerase III subunit [Oribacterium sp. WCC10]|uniref:DNA polymerase III subunit n=1 Tax=Oribacterium sp. WCC10 TaxID=1855343 RepID=UPI0008E4FA0C|nr:DNA polymerase III subunit delta' C-terminal domain-containing protein [Oribacterium sp. WCC10]SFG12496.1 DNA polymerase-3 subunit delta' [Oribacterium sp. WCC10]